MVTWEGFYGSFYVKNIVSIAWYVIGWSFAATISPSKFQRNGCCYTTKTSYWNARRLAAMSLDTEIESFNFFDIEFKFSKSLLYVTFIGNVFYEMLGNVGNTW